MGLGPMKTIQKSKYQPSFRAVALSSFLAVVVLLSVFVVPLEGRGEVAGLVAGVPFAAFAALALKEEYCTTQKLSL